MASKTDTAGDGVTIPAFGLYGERRAFPDVLHCELIVTRSAPHDWKIAPHRHPELHQFFHIDSGEARIRIDGVTQDLAPPVVMSIPRRTVHGFRFGKGTVGHVLTLPVSEFPESFALESALGGRLDRWGSVPADTEIGALFDAVHREHGLSSFARVPMLRALATQIACHMARRLGQGDATTPMPRNARRMAEFEDLIRRHFRERWRVADYADEMALTTTHLNRIVREATGRPASALIEEALFQEACRLLAYTRANVSSIGYALGFEDPAYFSRAFQRRIGLSPGKYRRRVGGDEEDTPV